MCKLPLKTHLNNRTPVSCTLVSMEVKESQKSQGTGPCAQKSEIQRRITCVVNDNRRGNCLMALQETMGGSCRIGAQDQLISVACFLNNC
jgi:hypothetical protein